MVIDMPWLNNFFGNIFGRDSDITPYPFKMFYMNLNLGSTYFLAWMSIMVLIGVSFLFLKYCSEENKYRV